VLPDWLVKTMAYLEMKDDGEEEKRMCCNYDLSLCVGVCTVYICVSVYVCTYCLLVIQHRARRITVL
jgi:hypothetical protein